MFYSLSKLIWPLIDPLTVLGLLTVASAVAFWFGRHRIGSWLVSFCAAFVIVVLVVPIGPLLGSAIEGRFAPNPELPDTPDGIIVLGGAVDPALTTAFGQPSVGGSFDRVLVFAELASRFPDARLVYTGGRHSADEGPGEAAIVAPILRRMGVDPERVMLEDSSLNTYQNAVDSLAQVRPGEDEVWVLTTTAMHMPRAVGAFRAAGWPHNLIPYPADFRYPPDAAHEWFSLAFAARLGQLREVSHEVVGLTAYYLTGRSDSWFPGPPAGEGVQPE